MPEGVAVSIRGRSYKIIANVDLQADAAGVIFAHGSRFRRAHPVHHRTAAALHVYNFPGIKPEQGFRLPAADTRQALAGHGVHPGESR